MTETNGVATAESTARELEPASNHYLTRRHLSDNLQVGHRASHGRVGRRGFSLCSTVANPVEVMDQAEHNYWSQRYELRDAKSIESLPLCKKCENKAAKRSGASR